MKKKEKRTIEADAALDFTERVLGDAAIGANIRLGQTPDVQDHFHLEHGLAGGLHVVLVAGDHHFSWNKGGRTTQTLHSRK